jgi:hypothetical protein|tara:strand:- start:610 stop:897 length:288 start_codon:yes stop_codon:yes gene_type:complete
LKTFLEKELAVEPPPPPFNWRMVIRLSVLFAVVTGGFLLIFQAIRTFAAFRNSVCSSDIHKAALSFDQIKADSHDATCCQNAVPVSPFRPCVWLQ